jgi:molybdate/tungstate transport system ATP-binding protein
LGLEILHLTKSFPEFKVGPLSLNLNKGVLVIVGPTGSGKTTILNLIAGIVKPDEGSIILDGLELTNRPIDVRRVGYVFQKPNLFPHLNVYENIVFGLSKQDRKNKHNQVKNLIDELGIAHLSNRKVNGLSGGEMQKISLARTLALEPKLILLDEPLAHLDTPARKRLRIEVRRILRTHGVPAIYVTHFEEDVYSLADSVASIHNGTIEDAGSLESILASSPSEFISEMLGRSNYIEGKVIESKCGITTITAGSHLLEILGEFNTHTRVGMLVPPEAIILSKELVKTSARNIIRAEVVNTEEKDNLAEVQLKTNSLNLMAKLTKATLTELDIKRGDHIYAIFKAISPQLVREEN